MKALVVDDSMTIRRIIVKSLSMVGINEVVEAGDGQEAVAASKADQFGIILMDWNMPKMSGIDALKAIRASGSKTPVIMVTTEAEKSRVVEAIKSGANNYLIKPFSPEQLAEKVKLVMGGAPVGAA